VTQGAKGGSLSEPPSRAGWPAASGVP